MLLRALILPLLAVPAFAASPPAITVPAGQIIVPVSTAITGISTLRHDIHK